MSALACSKPAQPARPSSAAFVFSFALTNLSRRAASSMLSYFPFEVKVGGGVPAAPNSCSGVPGGFSVSRKACISSSRLSSACRRSRRVTIFTRAVIEVWAVIPMC